MLLLRMVRAVVHVVCRGLGMDLSGGVENAPLTTDEMDVGEKSSDAENRWDRGSHPSAADTSAVRPQRVDCMVFPPLHEIFRDADEQETRACFPDLSEKEFRQLLVEMEAERAQQDNPPPVQDDSYQANAEFRT
mmetsp:Transcript_55030/g.160613  ORF Transcript_55030/g.160613 Transcript_55030/m.160613 type:complete len:134 (-) Transcript_55030:40-441(-)